MYPVMLDLAGKVCVIVGGGAVATRKVTGLLETGAQLVVISPAITAALQKLAASSQITWIDQRYQTGNLEQYRPFIVIAATDRSRINRQIADDARAIGALVNVVDSSADSDFHNMTSSQNPPLTLAVHTGGVSPALARHLLETMDRAIGDEYATLAKWLGELRPQISQQIASQPQRQAFYEAVIHSEALTLLRQGETETARQQIQSLVQEWTCAH